MPVVRRLDAVVVLLLAVGALALADSAIARPDGSPPGTQLLGEPAPSTDYLDLTFDPAISTGPDGHAIALVTQDGHAIVRRARPGHGFGRPRRLPLGSNPSTLSVAGGAGFAALAWTHFDATSFPPPGAREAPCCARLRAALLDPSGRLSRPRTLSAPGSNIDSALFSVRGRRAAIAWADTRGVRTSIATRGHGFSRPVTVTAPEGSLIGVALPRSTPHVFLVLSSNLPSYTVVEAWRLRGRTHRRTLGRVDWFVSGDRTIVAPSGRMLLAGNLFRDDPLQRRVEVATRRPGGRLRVTTLRVPGSSQATAIALAPSGRGLVATADGRRRLALRPVDPGGHVGPARYVTTISPLAQTAMAIDSSGAGVVTVGTVGGTLAHTTQRLVAWALGPGSRPGPRRTLSLFTDSWNGGPVPTVDRRVAWTEGRFTYAARLP
jgi:hypothetical protein